MLIDFYDSLRLLRENKIFLQKKQININFSEGKILKETIYAPIYLPVFINSAVDGYAVKFNDIKYVTEKNIIFLKVCSFFESDSFFSDFIAVEIMTGAKVPYNFDVIIKIEDVCIFDCSFGKFIKIIKQVVKNENVRIIGEDFSFLSLICKSNTIINLHHILIFSAFGIRFIKILNNPKIAFFSTGTELKIQRYNKNDKQYSIDFQKYILPSLAVQIFNITTIFVLLFFKRFHIIVDYYGCIFDDFNSLTKCFLNIINLKSYQIVLSTGAVSRGKHDFVQNAFKSVGGRVIFYKVSIKPGKPLLFGILLNNCVFFGLPGNVFASIFCLRFFVFYFILHCFEFVEYGIFFSYFLSIKKKIWKINFLYLLKSISFNFLEKNYVVFSFNQESFKLNALLTLNSFSFFYKNKKEILKLYSLFPLIK